MTKITHQTKKRLVIFFDGTWNDVHSNTNVHRLYSMLADKDKNIQQISQYYEGVGTQKEENFSGGVFGVGISSKIIKAYEWLQTNYERCNLQIHFVSNNTQKDKLVDEFYKAHNQSNSFEQLIVKNVNKWTIACFDGNNFFTDMIIDGGEKITDDEKEKLTNSLTLLLNAECKLNKLIELVALINKWLDIASKTELKKLIKKINERIILAKLYLDEEFKKNNNTDTELIKLLLIYELKQKKLNINDMSVPFKT